MKILITGGTGFIGTPLIEKILGNNHEILAISRKSQITFNSIKNIKWLQTNIILSDSCFEEIVNFGPECLINLAWDKIPDFTYQSSVENLFNQIDFLNKILTLKSIKKIINTGSCWEYNKKIGECNEKEECKPYNNFTWAKHSLKLFLDFHCEKNNIELIWTRIFYVFGPNQRAESLIPTILESNSKGIFPDIKTPYNSSDFIYIDDLVDALYGLMAKKVESGIYNIGNGTSISVIEVLKIAVKITGNCNLNYIERLNLLEKNEGAIKEVNFWADISKIQNEINWNPKVSMELGLTLTYNFKKIN